MGSEDFYPEERPVHEVTGMSHIGNRGIVRKETRIKGKE